MGRGIVRLGKRPQEASHMRSILMFALVVAALALPVAAVAHPATTKPKPVTISITAVNGRPVGGIKRPTIKKGKTVKIVVRTNAGKEVHLHGYNIEKPVVKGKATVITFKAKTSGRFELELHSPDTLLAQITVK
jgi:hypothetical protein